MYDRRYEKVAVVLKADEAAIEQMVGVRCQQQAVLAIQALLIRGVTPRLAVTGDEVLWPVDFGNPTRFLELRYTRLEKALPSSSQNDRLPYSRIDCRAVTNHIQLVLFPLLQPDSGGHDWHVHEN